MAFPCTENFDTYTNLDKVVGLNGGSGWSGAWDAAVAATGDATIKNNTSDSASNSMLGDQLWEGVIRDFANTSAGTLYWAFKSNDQVDRVYLQLGTTVKFKWRLNGTNIQVEDGSQGLFITVFTGVTNAWHTTGFEIDNSGHTYYYRLYYDGTWSDWTPGTQNSGTANVDRIRFGIHDGDDITKLNFDTIRPSLGGAASGVKSINGLLLASVKSRNGLAIASMKNWNGLA